MAISYPLAFPTTPVPRQITLTRSNVVMADESPFTLQQQIQEHQGQRWAVGVVMPPMKRAKFAVWEAWMASLKGRRGTFLLPVAKLMRDYELLGAGGGSPVVKGASQTGEELETDGWPNGVKVLKAGDLFSFSVSSVPRFFLALEDVTSDGSGNATIPLWPYIIEAPADDAPLELTSPQGVFRLASNDFAHATDVNGLFTFGFDCVEAI